MQHKIQITYLKKPKSEYGYSTPNRVINSYTFDNVEDGITKLKKDNDIESCAIIISELTSVTIPKIVSLLRHQIPELIIGTSSKPKLEATLHISNYPPKKILFERFIDCLAIIIQLKYEKIEFAHEKSVQIPDKVLTKEITPIEIAKILVNTDRKATISFSSPERAIAVVENILSNNEFLTSSNIATLAFNNLSFTLERTHQKNLVLDFSGLTYLTKMEPRIQHILSKNDATLVHLNFPKGSEEHVKSIITFFRSRVHQRPLKITFDKKPSDDIDGQLNTIAQRNKSLVDIKKPVSQYFRPTLSFSRLHLNDEDVIAITHFTQDFHDIRMLDVTHTSALPKNFFSAFKAQSKLTSLRIDGCRLDGAQVIEICEFISSAKTLETLSVRDCELDYDDLLERLSQSNSLPRLASIDIRAEGKTLKFSLISPLKLLVKLNHCKMIYNQSSVYSSDEIAFSSVEVDISAYQLKSTELAEILTCLSNSKTLAKLNISNTKINKSVLQALQACVNQIPTLTTILMDGCECVEDISDELMTLLNHPQLQLISLNDFQYDFSSLFVKSQGNIPKYVRLNNKLFCDAVLVSKTVTQIERANRDVSSNVKFESLNFTSLFSSPEFKPIVSGLLSRLLIIQSIGKIGFVSCQLCQESLTLFLDRLRGLPLLSDIDFSNSSFTGDAVEKNIAAFLLSKPIHSLSLMGTNLKSDIIFGILSSSDYQNTTTIISNEYANLPKLRELNGYILYPEKANIITLSNLDHRLLSRASIVLSRAKNLVEVNLSRHMNLIELKSILEIVTKNDNIRRLNFSDSNLSDDCINILVDYLLSPSCKVTSLDLSCCKISSPGIHRLCDMISKNITLITLNISNISSLETEMDLIGIALSENKTLIHLIALEDLPYPNSNLQVGAGTTTYQKENVKHLKSRIARVSDFAYALKFGERRPLNKAKKQNLSKNTSLLQADLFHPDIHNVATNKSEKGLILELSEILNHNRIKVRECFAELATPNPNLDKIKSLLRNNNQIQLSPYAKNDEADTPLHVAIRKGLLDVIKLYFKVYANWNIDTSIPNRANETVLSLAEQCGGDILLFINNPDKTPIAVVAKQPAKKKAKTAAETSNTGNSSSQSSILSSASQKHTIPVTATPPSAKKHAPDLSEAAPMDVEIEPLEALVKLIESSDDTLEDCLVTKGLLVEIDLQDLNKGCFLERSIRSKKVRMTRLLLDFGIDVNAKQSQDHLPLTIAAALNARPIFELILSHPMLSQDSVHDTIKYCDTYHQPFAEYYKNRCEIRLKESFLKPQNIQWVKDMPVFFGSKTPAKVVQVSSQAIQRQLFFKNAFTQTILSKAEGIEKDKPDCGGNPVTCCLTVITSGPTPNSRQSIQIPIDLPQKSFHVSQNGEDSIALSDLREKMQSRAEAGFEMVLDKSQFQQGQGKYCDPARITDEDLLNDVWFKQCFHHGEQSMISGLEDESVVTQIVEKIFASPQFVWGSKFYGLILDVCSPRYVCSNCTLAILSIQNPTSSPFLMTLSELLERNSCRLPKLSPLKMITRVGSYRAFEKSEPVTLALHSKICLDMKLASNKIILQEDIVQTSEHMTQFHSTNT